MHKLLLHLRFSRSPITYSQTLTEIITEIFHDLFFWKIYVQYFPDKLMSNDIQWILKPIQQGPEHDTSACRMEIWVKSQTQNWGFEGLKIKLTTVECWRKWKNWKGKHGEHLKEELSKETWSETRDQTESLALRLDLRHRVSFSTSGTGDLKTLKQRAPSWFQHRDGGSEHRAKGRLGRTSLGRRGQSPEAAAPPAPLQSCCGQPCPTHGHKSYWCAPIPTGPTHGQIENAAELILPLSI